MQSARHLTRTAAEARGDDAAAACAALGGGLTKAAYLDMSRKLYLFSKLVEHDDDFSAADFIDSADEDWLDDEEEEREAFEATEGGGSRSSNSKRRVDSVDDDNVTENKDAIGAGGEEEEDKLENLDMSWSEKEEHENAIREEEGNAAKGSSSKYSDNDDDALDAISAESSASLARIKKLKQLIKPRKMRVFLSLKAISTLTETCFL